MAKAIASAKAPLVKMGLKASDRALLLGAPAGFKAPKGAEFEKSFRGEFDFVLLFVKNAKDLAGKPQKLKRCLKPSGRAWIAWKKGGAADLNRDTLAEAVEENDLVAVANVAIDDEWSALKFMHPKDQRKA